MFLRLAHEVWKLDNVAITAVFILFFIFTIQTFATLKRRHSEITHNR